MSGILEIAIFHPFDTAGKRLMSFQQPIFAPNRQLSESFKIVNEVVYRDFANKPFRQQYPSLFKGVSAAVAYKVSQRIYRFGGQPIASEYVDFYYGEQFEATFGEKYCKPMMHALCGAFVGVGEMAIVPLDVLKIKRQTNPAAFKGRGVLKVIQTEGFGLYRGSVWTAARNGPGSFALFGGAALAKDHIFHLEDYNDATWFQNFVASIVGATACIVVANPLDVIKTRVQNKDFGEKVSGIKVIKDMAQKEGVGAFFKGFTPKLAIVGPKLIFAFTTAQVMIQWFDRHWFHNS